MDKMLPRTRQNVCKNRVAIKIRVILFFGIPTLYLVFLWATAHLVHPEDVVTTNTDTTDRFHARKLLGILESGRNCTPAAILEFPWDGLTRAQRQHGFILVHCILAIYCFLLLGAVCEQYFVPAIDMICERLTMEPDIAGATFMAAASSSPELFINCVGTFVTQGDLGVGAIVGSAVFNVLAVPACCALFAGRVINLDWWSISRDCLMYAVAVVTLILTLLDDKVYWHEALLLVLLYTLYILAMVFNGRLGTFVRGGCCLFKKPKIYTEITPLLIKEKQQGLVAARRTSRSNPSGDLEQGMEMTRRHDSTVSDTSSESSVWSWPGEKTSASKKFLWVLTWPISLVLWMTIPDCRRHPSLYPLTFGLCISWIGGVSYLVAWIITILGDTLNLPDSITGLTILAAGTSLPEAVSSVLVTNQGNGTMGISNTIGSNTFDILLCLGLPWLVKALFYPTTPGNHFVINLDWWSISRDCLMYAVAVVTLILTLLDDKVYWHEALLLVLLYTLYILAMVFNGRLGTFVRGGCCLFKKPKIYTEITPLLIKEKQQGLVAARRTSRSNPSGDLEQGMEMTRRHDSTVSDTSSESSVWSWPGEKTSASKKFLWVLTWPISLVLWMTIPDCRRHPSLYPLTFGLCISWIGGVSYLVAWIITILGDTLNLPDSITGLTILAAGTSLPEAVSSVLVTNQGNGTMGISNTIGSNTFDILLCLGLPWLVKALFYPTTPGNHFVAMNSSGISYSAISLLSTLFALYGCLAVNKFQLDWRVGVTCTLVYIGFIVFATLIEMNVFFVVNLPTCFH